MKKVSKIPDSQIWEYISDTVYYNKTNIAKSSNIISVWIYQIVTDDGRKFRIELERKINLEHSVKYQKYDHDVGLWEIDYRNRLYRNKDYMEYDDKGNVLYRAKQRNSKWERIELNTVWDKLYNKLCVTPKKPFEKK
jgi:hypothetical protein